MKFSETTLQGVAVVEREALSDDRGFFARSFDEKEFKAHGIPLSVRQCNISFNAKAGTLRGMHYQAEPYGEPKLVRCTRGALFDAVLDLRPESPTYKKWFGIELSADNGKALYIPKGCAHGFQTLEDKTEVHYLMGEFFHPESTAGVRFDDPAFAIRWPETATRIISEKDMSYPRWSV